MRRKFAATAAAVALGAFAFAAPAGAAKTGQPGSSYCSGSHMPDGIVTEELASWDNPGEAISFFSKLGEASKPGQLVKSICNPTLQINGEN